MGALVLKNNSKLLLCIFPEKEPGPCPKAVLYYCFQTVPLPCFYIPSLPWQSTVWICPMGGWIKPISYKWEMGDTGRICTTWDPTGFCLVSLLCLQEDSSHPVGGGRGSKLEQPEIYTITWTTETLHKQYCHSFCIGWAVCVAGLIVIRSAFWQGWHLQVKGQTGSIQITSL